MTQPIEFRGQSLESTPLGGAAQRLVVRGLAPPMSGHSQLFELGLDDAQQAVVKWALRGPQRREATLRLERETRLMRYLDARYSSLTPYSGYGTDPEPHVVTTFDLSHASLALLRTHVEPDAVLLLADTLFRQLAALHLTKVIHRDLKPGNLLVGLTSPYRLHPHDPNDPWDPWEAGDTTVDPYDLRFIDFSNAAIVGEPEPEPATGAGYAPYTKGWTCPCCMRRRQIDARCDVFAAGLVVFWLATPGRNGPPLAATNSADEVERSLDKLRFDLVQDEDLRSVLQEILVARPADRPTASDVVKLLGAPDRPPIDIRPAVHRTPAASARPDPATTWVDDEATAADAGDEIATVGEPEEQPRPGSPGRPTGGPPRHDPSSTHAGGDDDRRDEAMGRGTGRPIASSHAAPPHLPTKAGFLGKQGTYFDRIGAKHADPLLAEIDVIPHGLKPPSPVRAIWWKVLAVALATLLVLLVVAWFTR